MQLFSPVSAAPSVVSFLAASNRDQVQGTKLVLKVVLLHTMNVQSSLPVRGHIDSLA